MSEKVLDCSLGGSMASMPFWINYVATSYQVLLGVAGGALLVLRLLLAWREWKEKVPKA